MGHKAKWEYFRAVYERYHKAGREAKQMMLNEFCLNTGYHRKYAIRLLNGAPPGKQPERRRLERRPRYGRQVLSVLAAIWEAAGYCLSQLFEWPEKNLCPMPSPLARSTSRERAMRSVLRSARNGSDSLHSASKWQRINNVTARFKSRTSTSSSVMRHWMLDFLWT